MAPYFFLVAGLICAGYFGWQVDRDYRVQRLAVARWSAVLPLLGSIAVAILAIVALSLAS